MHQEPQPATSAQRPVYANGSPTLPEPSRELAEVLQKGPFSRALHLAIEASGLSLDRIQYRLAQRGVKVSLTTLSYWRHGRSRPERPDSLRGVHILEEVLRLPANSLMSLLGPRRPRGRWLSHTPGSLDTERLWESPDGLTKLLERLEVPSTAQLTRLSVHDTYLLGADRSEKSLRVREVVRAEVDKVSRHFLYYRGDDPDRPAPLITSTRYCRLGRVRFDPDSNFMVAELVLDRVLSAGDTTIMEFELECQSTTPAHFYDRRFRTPARDYVLQVHFDPSMVPARCFRYHRQLANAPEQDVQELWVGASNTAHFVSLDVSPGIYGVRWDWD